MITLRLASAMSFRFPQFVPTPLSQVRYGTLASSIELPVCFNRILNNLRGKIIRTIRAYICHEILSHRLCFKVF